MRVDEPGWFAVRIESTTKNELGQVLFAHSSPVYVEFAGKAAFDVEAAEALLKQVEEGQAAIAEQGKFSDPEAGTSCWRSTTRRRRTCAGSSTHPADPARARRTRTFPFARTPKTVTLPSVSRTLPK